MVKFIFSKNTSWIFTLEILQDSFKLSKGDSEKKQGFSTLFRKPGISILPRIVQISGGIDVCENFEKLDSKQYSRF